MHLHELRSPKGSKTVKRIIGRGRGSGRGKTSGRGQKGQMCRSGHWSVGPSEGGQSRLTQRLPKVGFHSHRPILYQVVNVERLNKFETGTVVDANALKSAQLVSSRRRPFKILGVGEIKKSLTIQGGTISKSAKEKIEKAGGKITQA